MVNRKVLFIGDGSVWSKSASDFVVRHFKKTSVILWDHGLSPKPRRHLFWKGDWILSFKSDLLLPKKVLKSARCGAINFHPAPPRYRGVWGYYHALKNGDRKYGITCHHMDDKVDNGQIIKVMHFPILEIEDPVSLKYRAGSYCLNLFYEVVIDIIRGRKLPQSSYRWSKRLYRYRDVEHLKLDTRT